jgi:hypothetical protein
MASAKQLAANRANSQKSTGPVTDAGKLNSRCNAVKHGLTGHTVLRTPEQDAAYNTYRARLYPDLAPANAIELDFAERIIYDSWRIHRASAIESNLFALVDHISPEDALNEAHAFQVNEKSIALLSLYQQRLQRGTHRDLEVLRKMQKERKSQPHPNPQMLSASVQLRRSERGCACPAIGSVCPEPPQPSSPPPVQLRRGERGRACPANDPENMAA